MFKGCIVVAFVILVWGVTFVNTRALLADFSALEIVVARFVLAAAAKWRLRRFKKYKTGLTCFIIFEVPEEAARSKLKSRRG